MSIKEMPGKWQEIRLFISSTFKDMQAERDYLVRFVFPRIREELLRYHIYFIDVDLRWGITDEDNIVGACRSIIDECHPLFLGILGGRYGWIPGKIEDSVSVTEDEIEYAVSIYKRNKYQRLLFLLRNEKDTLSVTETVSGEYREPDGSIAAKKLALLKKRILESEFPVKEYRARWDDGIKALTNLQAFGEEVYQYIQNYVKQEFDISVEYSSEAYDADEADLEIYIMQRNKFYIMTGIEAQFDALEAAAKVRRENNVILVKGSGGIGKSAFLCRFIQQCRQQNELTVLPHFVGVTPNSAELSGVLTALCRRLLPYSPSNDPAPVEIDRLIHYFQMLLLRLNRAEKYVLIIDGVNQIKQYNGALELRWLPLQIPDNLTLILSTATEETERTICNRWPGLTEISLNGLNDKASRQLVSYYLERYQKKLNETQIGILLSKESANVPLYLTTVIEELRIFGNYEKLTDFLNRIPGNSISLLEWILRHRMAESGEFTDENGQMISSGLAKHFFSYLYVSNTGLSENELTELLSEYAANGNIAALIRQVRPFISLQGELLNFFHEDIRKAIFHVYIEHEEIEWIHARLSGYFYSKADPEQDGSFQSDSLRVFRQLIYHTLREDDGKSAVKLINSGFFEAYLKIESSEHLLRTIREVVEFICKKSEGNIQGEEEDSVWQAGLTALRVYSQIADSVSNRNTDQPHPLERAIAEGRDEDVISLLDAANESQNICMRTAAAVLFCSTGREEAAQNIADAKYTGNPNLSSQSPAAMLYAALKSSEKEHEKATEQSHNEKCTYSDLIQVKPHAHIPPMHIFALNILGKWKYWHAVFFVIFCFACLTNSQLDIWVIRVEYWLKDWILLRWVSVICRILCVLILVGIPLLVMKLISSFLYKFVKKTSLRKICSLTAFAKNEDYERRTRALMRLSRYCRLLKEAKMLPIYPVDVEEVLIEQIITLTVNKCFDKAGSLLACMVISGINMDKCILSMAHRLTYGDKKETTLRMLLCKSMISRTKNMEFIKLVLKLYGNMPPVAVLSAALANPGECDERDLSILLSAVDKSILASCLLRSRITNEKKPNIIKKAINAAILLKNKFRNNTAFSVEPIPSEWYEVLINSLLLLAPLSIIYMIIYVCLFFGAALLFSFGFLIASLIISFKLVNQWIDYNEITHDIGNYTESILTELGEGKNSTGIKPIHLSCAVETALTDFIVKQSSAAEKIIQGCDMRIKVNILTSVLRMGKECRCRLLPTMLEAVDALPAVLDCIEKDSTISGKNRKLPSRKTIVCQWKAVRPLRVFPLSALSMGLLSAMLCAGILSLIYQIPVPWTQLLIRKDWWILLLLSFLSFLLPLPDLNSLYVPIPIFIFIAIGIFMADESILRPNVGAFIFYYIPLAVTLLTNRVLIHIRGRKLMFPTFQEVCIEKGKAVLLNIFGCLGIIAATFAILLCNLWIMGMSQNPEKSDFNALQNYSIVMFWPNKPRNFTEANIVDRLNNIFTGHSIYQDNLIKRIESSITINDTSLAVEKFGYTNEAALCRQKLMNYIGFFSVSTIRKDGKIHQIFLDSNERQIPIAYVVLFVSPNSEADKLGLREGDAIISLNGQTITMGDDLSTFLAANKATAKITIQRKSKMIDYTTHSEKLGVNVGYISLEMITNSDYKR